MHELRKVKLSILSDRLCKEIGNVDSDNLGGELVVNTRKELCGAFVNSMNVTFVNYTMQIIKKQQSERFGNVLRLLCNFISSGMNFPK